MKRIKGSIVTVAVVALVGSACVQSQQNGQVTSGSSAGSAVQPIDSVRLMRTISVLAHDSMEGRAVGTVGSRKAQTFLQAELRRRGVQPLNGSYTEPFRMSVSRAGTDSIDAVNIVGMIRGTQRPNRFIVLTAHYDHLGVRNGDVFNGADDNASGTAAILEMASFFAANPPSHTILIALFDAEERGLSGARSFVRTHATIKDSMLVNINLDMVGRNVANELYAAGTTPYPALLPYVETAAARSGLKLRTGHDIPGTGGQDWTMQSDHGAFHAAGIPFLYFGEEDHPDYHKATDEIQGIMPGFYANAVRTILDVVRQIDASPFATK